MPQPPTIREHGVRARPITDDHVWLQQINYVKHVDRVKDLRAQLSEAKKQARRAQVRLHRSMA